MGLLDQDLGNAVPQMIMGDDTGLFDDHIPSSCSGGGGEDALHQLTAPAAAVYEFDTAGTVFDTSDRRRPPRLWPRISDARPGPATNSRDSRTIAAELRSRA